MWKKSLLLCWLVATTTGFGGCPFKRYHSSIVGQNSEDSLAVPLVQIASPLELWAVNRLESMYHNTGGIKCPFLRRRSEDLLEGLDKIARFLVIRHKSLDLPLGCRIRTPFMKKNKNMDLYQIFRVIFNDWKISTNKGYYVSGRLNTTIYREDCIFDGPDPDMPVRGLRKFLNAASNLFEYKESYAELTSLQIESPKLLVAKWRMEGVLRLPWRPVLPEWTGATYYYLDDDNLVYLHKETWDMPVAEAFIRTFSPELGDKIWSQKSIFY